MTGLAVDCDMPSALLHDSVYGREPQPGSLAGTFGGEEGFKDLRQRLLVHSLSGVGDRQQHVASRTYFRVNASILRIEGDIGGLNRELASTRHGVTGVHSQIHDHLLELSWVGLHGAQTISHYHDQLDVFADQTVQDFLDMADLRVEVQNLGIEHLLAAEGEKLAGELPGALRGPADLAQLLHQLRVLAPPATKVVGITFDDEELVIEIMCHAGGQPADRFHLLALAQLLLQALASREVLHNTREEPALLQLNCIQGVGDGEGRFVAATADVLALTRRREGASTVLSGRESAGDQRLNVPPDCILRRIAEERLGRPVKRGDDPALIEGNDTHGCGLDDSPRPGLALMQSPVRHP